jgi:hypothetical protein
VITEKVVVHVAYASSPYQQTWPALAARKRRMADRLEREAVRRRTEADALERRWRAYQAKRDARRDAETESS